MTLPQTILPQTTLPQTTLPLMTLGQAAALLPNSQLAGDAEIGRAHV